MLQIMLFKLISNLKRNRLITVVIFLNVGMIGMIFLALFEGLNHNFKDIPDYISWWLGTVTTTGFTAMPETLGGRLVDAIFKIPFFLSGFGFLATLFSWLVEAITANHRGKGLYRGSDHVLIIGWNEITRLLLQKLEKESREIVLLDESLNEAPDGVSFFVRGDPTLDENLVRAGVSAANKIYIILLNDGSTGLTAASCKRLAPRVSISVITIEPENVDRHQESGVRPICITETVVKAVEKINPTLIFGQGGPVAKELRRRGFTITPSDPSVDDDLIAANIFDALTVFIESENDSHAWLAVSSIRAQNKQIQITVILKQPENRIHLERAGVNNIFCPTEMAVVKLLEH